MLFIIQILTKNVSLIDLQCVVIKINVVGIMRWQLSVYLCSYSKGKERENVKDVNMW